MVSMRTMRATPGPVPVLRLTHSEIPEDDLQEQVAKELDLLLLEPAVWWPMPIGHIKLTKAQQARLSRIRVKRGLPDLMVLHQGKVFGIELKRPGGRLSRTRWVRRKRGGALVQLVGQEDVFPRLGRAGMPIAVCYSPEGVLEQLRSWGVPVRRTT